MAEDILSISNYLEEELIKHTLGLGAFVPPAQVYAAILSDVSDDGDSITEIAAADYSRVAVPVASWAPPVNGTTATVADISWPIATSDWGTARAIGLYDMAVGGNLLYWAEFSVAKYIAFSAIFRITLGSLTLTLGGAFSLYLRNAIINATLRNSGFAASTNIWAGVGVGISVYNASLSEPAGYSRAQITDFAGTAGFRQIHAPQLQFIASGDWGLITHVGLFDAAVAGNLLYALQLPTAREIYDGDGIIFDVDTIGLSIQ